MEVLGKKRVRVIVGSVLTHNPVFDNPHSEINFYQDLDPVFPLGFNAQVSQIRQKKHHH